MNDVFQSLELQSLKPVVGALLLPPVPLLLLILLAAWLLPRHRRTGWLLIAVSVGALWASTTSGAALALARIAGLHPPALSREEITAMATRIAQAAAPRTAIVVLGGGRERLAPEYSASSLTGESLERLRYGLWLARQIHAPVGFSGGHGWAQPGGDSEARIAARIAAEEFRMPLQWIEDRSRDTRENARLTVATLRSQQVATIVLVTDGWHMRRALRAFRDNAGTGMTIEAAPMNLSYNPAEPLYRWLPSASGAARFRHVLRETIGLLAGA